MAGDHTSGRDLIRTPRTGVEVRDPGCIGQMSYQEESFGEKGNDVRVAIADFTLSKRDRVSG